MLRSLCGVLVIGLILGVSANAGADVYWADSVDGWTGAMQNYGGTAMDGTTTWWVTGVPDADVDTNGYAWDAIDQDWVAGWRGSGQASLTVYFDTPIQDGPGDDVLFHRYAGGSAAGSVWASSDGSSYTQIGALGSGTPGYFSDDWFDLGGLSDVQYIRVEREATGSGTGMFFDAVGAVPEPTTLILLAGGGWCALRRRGSCR